MLKKLNFALRADRRRMPEVMLTASRRIVHQADMVEHRASSPTETMTAVVDLIGLRAIGRDKALDQGGASALAEPRACERVNIDAGARRRDVDDMDRLRQRGAVGDRRSRRRRSPSPRSARPSASAVVGLQADRLQRRSCVQRLAQRPDAQPRLERREVGQFGANTPSTSTSLRAPAIACAFTASAARFSAAASGAGASGSTSRISARRSVYFHSSIRRCGRPRRS